IDKLRLSPAENAAPLKSKRTIVAIFVVMFTLAASSALTLRQNDLTPISLPTPITLLGWGLALVVLLFGIWQRAPALLAGGIVVELWLAAQVLHYNQLVPPDAYSAQRQTISQLLAYNEGERAPGRVLSISNLLFDPGDRAALEARYATLGMSPEAF